MGVDVWVGHSSEVLPRILDEFGPRCVDMAFFDQKGTLYHNDLALMERLDILADGALVVGDNVLKPGAPHFLWMCRHSPCWDLQVVSLREYESEAIEDWMSVSTYDAGQASLLASGTIPAARSAPRNFETIAFETDAIRWRAMTQQLNVSDWVRLGVRVRSAFEEAGICITAEVKQGHLSGLALDRTLD